MKRRGLFRVSRGAPAALLPEDVFAKQIINDLGQDKKALVSVHSARYPEHNGLMFAVLQKIADATGASLRAVIVSLLHEAGRFDYLKLLDRTFIPDPHSLSPESMTQDEFQELWDELRDIVKNKWRDLMAPEAFAEIMKMMEPRQ